MHPDVWEHSNSKGANFMQQTPIANRLHIAIFGKTNVGKSSLINALTNQPIAVVSDIAGTTTDPVYKTMEILPIGPVVIIDTPGIDDESTLGELRIKKTKEVLKKTNLSVFVIDSITGLTKHDLELIRQIRESNTPIVGVINKVDLNSDVDSLVHEFNKVLGSECVTVSAANKEGIEKLKQYLIKYAPSSSVDTDILGDLVNPGDVVVLVTPIDSAAPKGRLILPQQQVLRDVLDHGAVAVVTKETELSITLKSLVNKPALVITDSQAFELVNKLVPSDIPLTSFSILFSRYKGELEEMYKNIQALKELKPGDKVLIVEGCTHHRQKDDMGTVKIPRWLNQMVGGELSYEWASGTFYPEELNKYKIIIHCGGCMLNQKEMKSRIALAREKGVPIVNYGMLIGYVNGVLERAMKVFEKSRGNLSGKAGGTY